MSTPKKPVNYLNNRDLLKEIHLSKNSYCRFAQPGDDRYDIIIDNPQATLTENFLRLSDPAIITAAKTTRAARLSQETGTDITSDDIATTDLVFRIMTWEHIPLSPRNAKKATKKKTAREILEFDDDEEELFVELEEEAAEEVDDMIHTRVNFPPFQHFRLAATGTPICIGKSHWLGDLVTGEFSREHGQLTNKMAHMYLMICQKYAMKYNFRGYSYIDEMVASAVLQLTYVGLRFNEAKSNNPFAYYTQTITNAFCRVLNAEKKNQNIRDDILIMHDLAPSYSRMNQIAEN